MDSEIFASWSDSFDDFFGIYNAEDGLPIPNFMQKSLYYLILIWTGLYFLLAIISSLYIGHYTGEGVPRVAVAFGCLYRGIDPWYNVVPRLTTCTFLHYTLTHILLNSYSIGGSYALLPNSLPKHLHTWIYYWTIPVWHICGMVGSLVTYFGHLRRVSSFSVGASGGACGFSVFSTILSFTVSKFGSAERRDSQIFSLIQTLVIVGVQSSPLATLGSGKKVDWMAHLGGSLTGAVLAFFIQHMLEIWDEPSILRLGALLTSCSVIISGLSFFLVLCQFCQNHEQRVRDCYVQWLELDKLELDRAQQMQRRWTLGQAREIERILNLNPRPPRNDLTDDQLVAEEEFAIMRSHQADPDVIYFNTRSTPSAISVIGETPTTHPAVATSPEFADANRLGSVTTSLSDNLDKELLSICYCALIFAGGSLAVRTKMDELDELQYRFACAAYFGLLPLIVLGYLALPWITIFICLSGGLLGFAFVGSPRTTIKLKETTCLCLAATCISAWLESLSSALFDSASGYGAPLALILRPKTALSFALCRGPIALSAIGLIAVALRYLTVNVPKPSRIGTFIIAFTSSTLCVSGLSSLVYVCTNTIPPTHPFAFFGGPTRFAFGDQASALSLLLTVLGTLGIFIYRDNLLLAELHNQYRTAEPRADEVGQRQPLQQSRNRAEIWRRSFSGNVRSVKESEGDGDSSDELLGLINSQSMLDNSTA